jgi:hypothetical protein
LKPIIVSKLRVESVTGETCYRNENGFSALTAYVSAEDPAMFDLLKTAHAKRETVSLRCATLEIDGIVGNLNSKSPGIGQAVAISIDDLRYRKPR